MTPAKKEKKQQYGCGIIEYASEVEQCLRVACDSQSRDDPSAEASQRDSLVWHGKLPTPEEKG